MPDNIKSCTTLNAFRNKHENYCSYKTNLKQKYQNWVALHHHNWYHDETKSDYQISLVELELPGSKTQHFYSLWANRLLKYFIYLILELFPGSRPRRGWRDTLRTYTRCRRSSAPSSTWSTCQRSATLYTKFCFL